MRPPFDQVTALGEAFLWTALGEARKSWTALGEAPQQLDWTACLFALTPLHTRKSRLEITITRGV